MKTHRGVAPGYKKRQARMARLGCEGRFASQGSSGGLRSDKADLQGMDVKNDFSNNQMSFFTNPSTDVSS